MCKSRAFSILHYKLNFKRNNMLNIDWNSYNLAVGKPVKCLSEKIHHKYFSYSIAFRRIQVAV